MNKLIYVMAAVFTLSVAACGNASKKSETTAAADSAAVDSTSALDVTDVLATAETNAGKPVTIKGLVTHTCKHSGRRCFLVGKDQKTSIRVEAKGNIGGFNRELIGSEIIVKGTLRENGLTKEYIDQMEKDVNEKKIKEDGSAESCQAEMNNIASMREWMKANNKDFYSIYYVDGTDYEVAE